MRTNKKKTNGTRPRGRTRNRATIENSTSERTWIEWTIPISPRSVRKRPQRPSLHSQRRLSTPSASPPESSHSNSSSSSIVGHAVGVTTTGNPSLDHLGHEHSTFIGSNGGASLSLQAGAMPGLSMPWDIVTSTTHLPGPSYFEGISMAESDMGSYGSSGSMEVASASTVSAASDGYVFPISPSVFDSPGGSSSLLGLALPNYVNQSMTVDQAIQHTENLNNSSPATSTSSFDNHTFTPLGWNLSDMLSTEPTAHSAAPLLEAPHLLQRGQYIRSQNPWTAHDAHGNIFSETSNPGCVAYEPEPSPMHSYEPETSPFIPYEYEIYPLPWETSSPIEDNRLTMPGQGSSSIDLYGPEPPNINWFDESDTSTSYSNALYTPSHGSPASHHSPHPQGSQPQPSPSDVGNHSHVFRASLEPQKNNVTKGRVRRLTDKEKREMRDVREARACWTCHLSKIKCSPCSSGFPCEQCTRLAGKRRFCLLTCFNDPIETLDRFLVPENYIKMYTTDNTKRFISENADAWGTDEMMVGLSWGYRVPLKVTVVPLSVRGSTSVFRYQHQTYINASGRPTFTRKKSPPLGIPLLSMEESKDEYALYIKRIVRHDLDGYVRVAYEPEESDLAKRLIKTVCQFCTAGVEANDEYKLLREAIEIHIACVILERSLILDNESTNLVEWHLGEDFPADSSPRCASRQIKLAFFISQQERIKEVLEEWAQMMWTSSLTTANELKWAIGFSVLLVLTLVMDKTLGLEYCNAESRVKHGGKEAEIERKEFQTRVKFTQTNLFERCKEIFHSRFKTRKWGKESFNPIRDGKGAWHGKVIDDRIVGFVNDMQSVVRDFDR
ncbi:hypothetical protein DSL72_000360 [Monilinia vaccinii-corymbosi]|uniref:Zn(2)-C6 fungal-type domain-containing protein n=1 Tax=Monilinia vaccinii-corymbosi TaxID=61207 RepID=A0A8A3P1E8_9HELO|nr:hypothetical protein DSL72_000360 [Monilinia vaccinii-corymbosi]